MSEKVLLLLKVCIKLYFIAETVIDTSSRSSERELPPCNAYRNSSDPGEFGIILGISCSAKLQNSLRNKNAPLTFCIMPRRSY